jgi:hypothetical protein
MPVILDPNLTGNTRSADMVFRKILDLSHFTWAGHGEAMLRRD